MRRSSIADRQSQKVLTPADRTILVWSMSLSNFTKFLLDAAFTLASAKSDRSDVTLWLNLAEQSHGGEPTPAEWAEVRQMIVDDFPELIERYRLLLPYLDQKAQEPHPTCGCGS